MKKFNKFVEKYEVALWQLIAALGFLMEYFYHKEIDSLLFIGIF